LFSPWQIILSMAYYGKRRPAAWPKSILGPATFQTVSQAIKMSASVTEEGVALVHWLRAPTSLGGLGLHNPICVTGVSLVTYPSNPCPPDIAFYLISFVSPSYPVIARAFPSFPEKV
jgi:hypothetical protein